MRRSERMRAFRRGYSAGRQLTGDQIARLEQKLADQLSEQRAFLLEVIGEGLGQHRREVVAELNDTFAAMQSALRSLQGANGGSNELIDLLGPPVSRRLQ